MARTQISLTSEDRRLLAIAATAIRNNAVLLTRNIRHFPMFPTLQAPY